MDFKHLAHAISREFETAREQSSAFVDQDIVLFIGCCGSGKSTVTSYALGTSFRYNRRCQAEENQGLEVVANRIEGLRMSGRSADVTHGLFSAEVPSTNGLMIVDNAGIGATKGTIAEVCGAIDRSVALQSARSVRVVLVIKEALGDVGVERGRLLLKGVEHVASMFCLGLENLSSVGLIMTSDPRNLQRPGISGEVAVSFQTYFNGLLQTAIAEEEYVDRGDPEAARMMTTALGVRLLQHFSAHCNRACDIARRLEEGDDDGLLRSLCTERVTVFPVNVLQEEQRLFFQTWLSNLPPIHSPGRSLKYDLLRDAKVDLEQHLNKFFFTCKELIWKHQRSWASQEEVVSQVTDFLKLARTLEETDLLPAARKHREDLKEQILRENHQVVAKILEGIQAGQPETVAGEWPELLKMDAFKQEPIYGWKSSFVALSRGIEIAKESLAKHLPGGFADARWNLNLALQVKGILSALQKLEPLGDEVLETLKKWASDLSDHVDCLQKTAGNCEDAAGIICALRCLKEHGEFLPQHLMPVLGSYGCQSLEGDGLRAAEEAGKEAVRASLSSLSGKMVEEALKGGNHEKATEQLSQLCKSTELNAILGCDLEKEYIVGPLSATLAPSQNEIDNLVARMEAPCSDDWGIELLRINERVRAAGENGPRVLCEVDLKLDAFCTVASQRIGRVQQIVIDAIKKLLAPKTQEVYDGSWAVLSVEQESQDTEPDTEMMEDADAAIHELELLTPVDMLLKLMRPAHATPIVTVAVALQYVSEAVRRALQEVLKKAERIRNKGLIPTASLGAETIKSMRQLKALNSLVDPLVKGLQSLQDHASSNLAEKLSSVQQTADGFVDRLVQQELQEWNRADTNVKGWHEVFHRHIQMAYRLVSLDNEEEHLRKAFGSLHKKVEDWHHDRLREATETLEALPNGQGFSEDLAAWQRFVKSVTEGLAFEQTPLFEQLEQLGCRFDVQFHTLVEAQSEICQQEAVSGQPNMKLLTWQKLTTLIFALRQLPTAKCPDSKLGKMVKDLVDSREPLSNALEDDESRFTKALGEGRFAQAAQLLKKVPAKHRHGERLKEYLLDAMDSAKKRVDDDTEVENLISAVKDARRLIQEVASIDTAEAAVYTARDELLAKLTRKSEEVRGHLQLALDGRHAPSCALQLRATLMCKSKQDTAREAIAEYVEKKKAALEGMSISDLSTWITIHERVWRNLPEEFQNDTDDYLELLRSFQKCFENAFEADFQAMYAQLDKKQWGEAREKYQVLKNAIDDLMAVERLKAYRDYRVFKKLQNKLKGVAGRSRCTLAKEDIKKGEFSSAVNVVVTSNGEQEEVELLELINEEVGKNLRMSTSDSASLHERLTYLKSFLEAVGENPPDELIGLCKEVKQVYHKALPQLDQKVSAAVSDVLEATAAMDLGALAAALANFQLFEGGVGVSESQQEDVVQAQNEFWQRIKGYCNKVASSIELQKLDVNALSLSLEPLKGWLDSFQVLSERNQKTLMHPDPSDLQAWMREVLAEPLRRLLDPCSLMASVEKWKFDHLRLRCMAAQKLHTVLGTDALDLKGVEGYLSERKDSALQALSYSNLNQFNTEVKFCKMVTEELQEMPLPKVAFRILADLENELRERFLKPHLSKLRAGMSITETAIASQDIRKVANSAADTHEWVTLALEAAFQDLQNNVKFNVTGLADLKKELVKTQLGQTIVIEHEAIFGALQDMQNNDCFRRAGERQILEDIVGFLTRKSGLDDHEYHELVGALRNHEIRFGHLKRKYLDENKSSYLAGQKTVDDILKDGKDGLDLAVQACNSPDRSAEWVLELVAHVAICFTLVKSAKKFLDASVSEQDQQLWYPHKAQILTLFRFLQCHKSVPSDPLWKRFYNWVHEKICGSHETSQSPENHLAQILTGEGKCLTLGLLASILALNGLESDIVCYRKFLTEQDGKFMRPFFCFLGVEQKIRYLTFDELCEECIAPLRQGSKELIEKGSISVTRQEDKLAKRVCLIDEVDILVTRRFYGRPWEGGFTLTSPEAASLVRHIFTEAAAGRSIRNITNTQEFEDFLECYPKEMDGILTSLAGVLVQNVEQWSKPEPLLDEKEGRIGYKGLHEVDYTVKHGHKTVFAYLHFEKEGKLTAEQVREHVGMDLSCGKFSFTDLPKFYRCILGVTGTLTEFRKIPGFEKLLEDEYGFKHWTITPSIFGEGRLSEHVQVLDEEEDWSLCIERLVDEHTRGGDAVLVFFKNEKQLRKFRGWKNMDCLTERTDAKRRQGYIAAASTEGKVTLLTKAFGRGIDFQMPDTHRLVVVQTYLSSLVSEETQIKGRTARQGRSGLFYQVLCSKHLEAKMGFSEAEVDRLHTCTGKDILALLKSKQTSKTLSKLSGMKEKRSKTIHLESETKEFEKFLFGDADASAKLKKLASLNEVFPEVHYSVLLDISGSMYGSKKKQMDLAFSRFREQLQEQEKEGSRTMVSVVLFNHETQVVVPTHAKASELQDISHRQVGGRTNFRKAFAECRQLMTGSPSAAKELILFLTDGMAAFPESEITGLLAEHSSRIKCFTCVALGDEADTCILKQIGSKFQEQSINFKLRGANDQETLVTAFKEAASSRAIHCR